MAITAMTPQTQPLAALNITLNPIYGFRDYALRVEEMNTLLRAMSNGLVPPRNINFHISKRAKPLAHFRKLQKVKRH
jgi:hypothetical protein